MNTQTVSPKPASCPIVPGFVFSQSFFDLFAPHVREVGQYVRVGGGWVVPVKFRRRCALLRHYQGDGSFSIDTVREHHSSVYACQYNLEHSAEIPKVLEDEDPGVLRLFVIDRDGFQHILRFTGLLGSSGKDEALAISDGEDDIQ